MLTRFCPYKLTSSKSVGRSPGGGKAGAGLLNPGMNGPIKRTVTAWLHPVAVTWKCGSYVATSKFSNVGRNLDLPMKSDLLNMGH